jgi:tetratricopeptide (TPR) repeat protein
VRAREPQLVTLVGVPGIGKSRLVSELFLLIERMPDLIWWRQGRALPYGSGVSFWAVGEMVKAHAGINENDVAGTAAEKLRESVAQTVDEHERDWVRRHLETLLGLSEDAALNRNEPFAAWRRYFEGMAEQQPLVLVFEDLHWADDGLLDFVDHLAEWASGVPILVLASARPELLDRRPNWGGGKLNAVTLALSPLGDADAARVIAGVLEQAVLPAETQAALLEQAGGNPLYAEQFARLYLEDRNVAVPENVQGIIAARLDGLPEEEKRLLQDAAVLGKVFWSGGVSSSDVALHALERKGFIRRERRSAVAGESEYAFRHVLVREVAYGQIPRSARAGKHVAAAEWTESLGRSDDHAELIAHHYACALELLAAAGSDVPPGLHDRARTAFRRAGDRAAALNAFGVAAEHYAAALELWGVDEADRPPLLYALGRAEYVNGESTAARLHESVDALLAGGFVELAAEAEALGAEAAWYRGNREELEQRLAHALELVEPLPPSRAKAWILSQTSRYAMLAIEHDRAIEYGTRALEMAEELELPDVRVHALNNLGSSLGRRVGGGIAELETSIALAEEINSPELARSLNNLASIQYSLGNLRECFNLEGRSIEVAERFGLESMLAFSHANRLGSQIRLGMWDELSEGVEEILASKPAAGPAGAARSFRSWVRVARDDLEGALEDSTFALEVARRAAEPQALLPTLNAHAYVLDAAGEREEARRVLAEVRERLEPLKAGGLPFQGPGVMVDTRVRILGRDSELELLTGWRHETPWIVAGLALVQEDFDRAIELYAAMESVVDVALVHLRAAQKLVAAGHRAESEDHLRSAISFYRSVRATRYMREAETLLAASA